MTTPTTSTTPLAVTDADFDTHVSNSDVPVLVDFHADWCAPCRAVSPVLHELASELGDSVRIVQVDIDANPALVERFGVSSIPTLVFFRNGEEVDRLIGAASKDELTARLQALA